MHKRTIGLILILLGILIFVSLVTLDTLNLWRLWSTGELAIGDTFPTFLACCWNYQKSTTVMSFLLSAIPFYIGILLRRQQPHGRQTPTVAVAVEEALKK